MKLLNHDDRSLNILALANIDIAGHPGKACISTVQPPNNPGTDVFRAYKQDKPNWLAAQLVDIDKVVKSGHAILLKKFPKEAIQIFRTVFAPG